MLGRLDVHQPRLRGRVGQNFAVYQRFDFNNLLVGNRRVVRKVKPRALGVHQTALLLYVGAQHLAQRLVHQVRGRVVAHARGAQRGIHVGRHGITHLERTGLQHAVVAIHIGLDLLRVAHFKHRRVIEDGAFVAHLAAGFGVKRCGVEHNHAVLTCIQGLSPRSVCVERYDFGSLREAVVAHEVIAVAGVLQRLVHLEFAGGSACGFLSLHCSLEAGFVHRQTALTAHIG